MPHQWKGEARTINLFGTNISEFNKFGVSTEDNEWLLSEFKTNPRNILDSHWNEGLILQFVGELFMENRLSPADPGVLIAGSIELARLRKLYSKLNYCTVNCAVAVEYVNAMRHRHRDVSFPSFEYIDFKCQWNWHDLEIIGCLQNIFVAHQRELGFIDPDTQRPSNMASESGHAATLYIIGEMVRNNELETPEQCVIGAAAVAKVMNQELQPA